MTALLSKVININSPISYSEYIYEFRRMVSLTIIHKGRWPRNQLQFHRRKVKTGPLNMYSVDKCDLFLCQEVSVSRWWYQDLRGWALHFFLWRVEVRFRSLYEYWKMMMRNTIIFISTSGAEWRRQRRHIASEGPALELLFSFSST